MIANETRPCTAMNVRALIWEGKNFNFHLGTLWTNKNSRTNTRLADDIMRIAIKDKNKVCVVRSDGRCWNDAQSTVHQCGALHVYLVCMIGGGLVNTGLRLGG